MRLLRIELALLLVCAVINAQAQSIRILVQSSPLAGFQYHAGAALWAELKVGDSVLLTREPDNPHDRNAVRVDWRGQPLGYLPRAQNAAVAIEMDRGGRLEGRIARMLEHRDPWRRVLVDVYLVL